MENNVTPETEFWRIYKTLNIPITSEPLGIALPQAPPREEGSSFYWDIVVFDRIIKFD